MTFGLEDNGQTKTIQTFHNYLKMPTATEATAPSATVKSENAASVQVLDELLNKLSISKTADESNQAAGNLASFINGPIEEKDAPTK